MTNNQIDGIMNNIDLNNKEIDENKLYFLTGKVFGMEEVISKSQELDTKYKHVYKPYGFEDFYSMYLCAKSNTEMVSKGGQKDLSNLNKVKRKVMRNGKMVEMTIYESGDKEEEDKEPTDSKDRQTNTAIGAKQRDNGSNSKVNPQKLATTFRKLKEIGSNIESVSQDAEMYREYLDEAGNPIGISAYSENDTTVILEGFAGGKEVTGIGIRSVMELIKLGIEKEKGILVRNVVSLEAQEFLKMIGFKNTKEDYKMSKQEVKNYVGEYGDFL